MSEFNQENVAFLIQSEICCSRYVNNKKQNKLARDVNHLWRKKKNVVITNIIQQFSSLYSSDQFTLSHPQEEQRVVHWFKNK